MNILFLMTSKYPTHKAYGVTTGETARALREIGNNVKILSFSGSRASTIKDQYDNEVTIEFVKQSKFFQSVFSRIRFTGPLLFTCRSILVSLRSTRFIRASDSKVIWTRDVFSALILMLRSEGLFYVIELHHFPGSLKRLVLKLILSRHQVLTLAIQKSMHKKLAAEFPKAKVLLAPMGVNQSFLARGESKLRKKSVTPTPRPLKVCFLGRATSSDMSNGIEQLLEIWQNVPSALAELTIIGLTAKDLNKSFESRIHRGVSYIDQVHHSDVPDILTQFDCGIIPYPDSLYNSERFPIKALEYCAVGLNLILTETRAHRELVDEQIGYFYHPNNPISLEQTLVEISSNQNVALRKAEEGHRWARGYTYSSRIRETIKSLKEFQF